MCNSHEVKNSSDVGMAHMVESSERGQGFLTGPGIYQMPVDYAVVNGLAIHAGCIDLGPVEEVEAEAAKIRAEQDSQRTEEAAGTDGSFDDVQRGVGLPVDSNFLWTNGVVPYSVDSNVPNQKRVTDAIAHIQQNTAIRFVRRTSSNSASYPNYVRIISNGDESWSSSAVGMRGGRQFLRLADGHSWPILVHEFLHALGVYHEQSRSDRDEFVEIVWSNIDDDFEGNFQKKPGTTDYYGYDYDSIMHYRANSFAIDRTKPTIIPRKSGVTIGQRKAMSFGDRQTIAKMYQRFFARGFSGVWQSGSGKQAVWVNASWQSFLNKRQEWGKQGLRLHDIHVRRSGNNTRYSGVFRPGSGRHGLWANVSWQSFRDKWQEWSADGLRLVDMHIHRVGNENRYSGVFLPGSGGHGLWVNQTWSSFTNKWRDWSKQGLRLVDLHVHRVNGNTRYSGVFLPGSGGYALWANATWGSFIQKRKELSQQGLHLVDLNVHRSGGNNRYSGVFMPKQGGQYLWANVTFEGFKAKNQELAQKGYRLIDFEITNPEDSLLSFGLDIADDVFDEAVATENETDHEEFGGIFEIGEDPRSALLAELEDGGGDVLEGGSASTPATATADREDFGGAVFGEAVPTETTESETETDSEEGMGAVVFGTPEIASIPNPDGIGEGIGGAVLTNGSSVS